MTLTRVVEAIVFCCLFLLKQPASGKFIRISMAFLRIIMKIHSYPQLSVLCAFQDILQEHKITPPSKVCATLGTDVHFRWKLSFGNYQDRNDFDGIVWGHMNERKKIINKYISISQQGKPHPNTRLSRSLQDKLSLRTTPKRPATWTSLVLKNFIADDTKTTYGCTAEVYGNFIRDGPIHLDIAGKVHFTGLLFLVAIRIIGKGSC